MMEWMATVRDGAAVWLSVEVGRATVLLLAALGAAVVLRRASAAARHLLWCATVVSLLALPALSAVMPWRWSPVAAPAEQPVTVSTVRGDAPSARPNGSELPVSPPSRRTPQTSLASPSYGQRALGFVGSHGVALVFGLWIAGALLSLARLGFGGAVLRRMVRRARPLDEPAWRTPLYEAADRLELRSAPRLVLGDRMPMPFVTGLIRPTIVLPASAADWPAERRRAVLLHELAHVRRRDLMLNAVGHVACALWWFHPLVRMAARRLRAESERACDDLVLRLGTRPSAYADHLLQIVRDAGRVAAPSPALPMGQRREFEGRMLAILEADARRDPPRRRHAALALVAGALLVVPLAGLGPVPARAAQEAAAAEPAPPQLAGDTPGQAAEESPAPPEADEPAGRALESGDSKPAPPGPSPQVQDTGVIAALRAALNDPSGEVRAQAAWALGSMDAVAAGPDLVALLGRDGSPEVRTMAVWALVELDHAGGVPAIAEVVRSDDDAEVREMAAWALGQFEDPAMLPALVAALDDEAVEVRSIAAWAIGTLEPSEAPPALIDALQDEDGEVREHAAWALGQIGDPDAVAALTRVITDDTAGEAALWAIGNIGGEAARPALLEALRSGNDEVRAAAARALAGRTGRAWPWPWPRPMPNH